MISQKTRYALRALLHLVEKGRGAPVQLGNIAESQQVPRKYLELIMLDLKRAGIVTSVRGPSGGYRLARSPAEISFGEVIRVLDGPIALVPCASVNFYSKCGDCHDEETCAIRRVLAVVRDTSAEILEGTSLADAAAFEEAREPETSRAS
jgi:Rrf2 family protein